MINRARLYHEAQALIAWVAYDWAKRHQAGIDFFMTTTTVVAVMLADPIFALIWAMLFGGWNFHHGMLSGSDITKAAILGEGRSERDALMAVGAGLVAKLEAMPPGTSVKISVRGNDFVIMHVDDLEHVLSLASLRSKPLPEQPPKK